MSIHTPLTKIQQDLINQVQHNCDISDANHAGNYTLCIYLLKMREYYRWIHALDFSDNFENDQMSHWLREKEEIWDRVVDHAYQPITLFNNQFEIYDNHSINTQLKSHELFYHAGIGRNAIQHFFVAELVDSFSLEGTRITVTGKEYARDLTAPPAMSTAEEIVVRKESLQRMCWERYQEWHWNQLDNPMGTALSYYPFKSSLPDALQSMVDVELNTLIHHELGEMKITRQVGLRWSSLMLRLLGSKAELMARAVRDHLADSWSTLPFLIEQQNPAALHFFFANLTYMRKELFPTAIQAYQQWAESGDISVLSNLTEPSAEHWYKTVQSVLAISEQSDQNPASEIISLIEQSPF